MRTTRQLSDRNPDPLQPASYRLHVGWFTVVAGASQCQLDLGQGEGIGGTGGHQRDRLDRLEGGAGQDPTGRIPPGVDDGSVSPNYHRVDLVPTFDAVAPGDLDEQRRPAPAHPVPRRDRSWISPWISATLSLAWVVRRAGTRAWTTAAAAATKSRRATRKARRWCPR